ncbi:hypothetical protein KIK06_16255 [Nocardiopsis sp. EMB25]|uniref:hypothetical protein n=1 Tax=Nocardiopsis TaxID=2013 RepID=UPI00034CD11A|nr:MULTISPECIES: hypothetical protein [Nocardiopsis]MCY9785439.1 hypothetical protein [Nocardiopsis sp. EMB25]
MYETVSSPSVPEQRPEVAAQAPRTGLLSGRRPGERPPSDVQQTCALMFVAGPFFGFLAYAAWDRLGAGAPTQVVTDLRTLFVLSALTAAVAVGLAVPVLRAVPLLWRVAQFGALAGMGVALSGLHRAAQISSTLLLVAAALAALVAIVVNIALWTTAVRRWCDVRGAA